jgi:DNA polymerase-3 subunit beta
VESDGDARNIVCLERSKFTLAAENPADFPTLPDMEHESNLTLPGDTLGKMIRRTLFATDNDSSRYALGGLLFENDGKGHVHVVATDGRRMAKVTHDTDGAEQSCIVPSRTAKIIASAIKGNEPASFSFDGAVWFRHNGTRIYSRFMESRFPKWRDVIPSKAHDAHTFELPVEPIATAVRHAAIVMDAEQACGVEFSFKEGMLTLDALNVEVGQALVQVPIQDGPTVSTCLDYRYVADFLAVLDSETFLMTVRDEDSAVLLEQGDYQYVVMPLTRGK